MTYLHPLNFSSMEAWTEDEKFDKVIAIIDALGNEKKVKWHLGTDDPFWRLNLEADDDSEDDDRCSKQAKKGYRHSTTIGLFTALMRGITGVNYGCLWCDTKFTLVQHIVLALGKNSKLCPDLVEFYKDNFSEEQRSLVN